MIVVIPAECGVTLYGGKRFRFRAAGAAAERDGGSWLRPATRPPKQSRSTQGHFKIAKRDRRYAR